MNIPRFHIDPGQADAGTVLLGPEESRHALSVLRLKPGEAVELFDGHGHVLSGVLLPSRDGRAEVLIHRNAGTPVSGISVTLGVSVIKPERMDWLIEKSCELGVSAIAPFTSARTVVKLSSERWKAKEARWRKIALAACKQCGQSRLPDVRPVSRYTDVIRSAGRFDLVLIPTLAEKGKGLRETLEPAKAKSSLVLIGPEGDFTSEEISAALAVGARAVTLGPLTLRSETAALYALSVFSFIASKKALN